MTRRGGPGPAIDPAGIAMPTAPRLTAAGAALLVVDLQARLVPSIRDADRVVAAAARLARAAHLLDLPVVATEQVPAKLGPTVAPLLDLLPDRLPKATFHAGGAPGLWEFLAARAVRHVALVGIEAHICVAQTALELLARGFAVQVPVDAVGSRFAVDRAVALRRLDRAGAILTTAEATLFEWVESAEHPQFRAISALVKERAAE